MEVAKNRLGLAGRGPSTEHLGALRRVLHSLVERGDLAAACELTARALSARACRIVRVAPGRQGLWSLDEQGLERPYRPEPGGPVERALRRDTAVFETDSSGAGLRESLVGIDAPASLAAVPLRSGGATLGVLLVGFDAPHPLHAGERRFIQALADAVTLTLERAGLERALDLERRRAGRLETRLRERTLTPSRLVAEAAHELRSPITAIKAYAEALLHGDPESRPRRDRILGIIDGECDRLALLIADILDLSRLEAGERTLRIERFDLAHLIGSAAAELLPLARARPVAFDLDIEPNLVVEADPALLRRVLVNLLENAVKHSPRSGRIGIRARARGGDWTGSVEDQGAGIPPQDLPRVFERFFRSRDAQNAEIDGHGLGLAIVREIVELHGGRVWAEPGAAGGARLCFTLPVRRGPPFRE